MMKFLRNLAVAAATIIGFTLVMIIAFAVLSFVVSFLFQFALTWYILLGSIILLVFVSIGWQIADDNGWIKK